MQIMIRASGTAGFLSFLVVLATALFALYGMTITGAKRESIKVVVRSLGERGRITTKATSVVSIDRYPEFH